MKLNDVNFLSRKLIVTAILFICSILFMIFDKATFSQWADFMKWIFGIYCAGNGISKAANHLNNK